MWDGCGMVVGSAARERLSLGVSWAPSPVSYTAATPKASSHLLIRSIRQGGLVCSAHGISVDPIVGLTQSPYDYVYDNPLTGTDPSAGDAASTVGGGIAQGWNDTGGEALHAVAQAGENVSGWANTPTCLPNADWFTALPNALYGGYKLGSGAVLIVGGSAADLTGLGALVGAPSQAYGIYQVGTGGARIYRFVKQARAAFHQSKVRKTPFQCGEDIFLNVAPFGGGITNFLGGLP